MTLDETLYHFNYLTLLLVGMFDVQARVARRVYNLRGNDIDASFWKRSFVTLLDAASATALAALVRRDEFINLGILLKKLRNTIHSVAPHARVEQIHGSALSGLLTVDSTDSVAIWNAAEQLGGAESWGLSRPWKPDEVALEPYAYCLRLLTNAFRFLQEIADATDVLRLMPPGATDPPIGTRRNDPLEAEEHRRVVLLG